MTPLDKLSPAREDVPTTVYKLDGHGADGHIIIEVRVFQERPFNKNDERAVWEFADKFQRELHAETARLDPDNIAWKAEWLVKARQMFSDAGLDPVYMEEIDNQYCGPKCCPHRVWLIVTTRFGRVKFGWRKRVLSIDWTDSKVTAQGDALFPNEDVTKSSGYDKERYIHAWSEAKAVEYLKVLAQASIQ